MDPGIIASGVAGVFALTGIVLTLRSGAEQSHVTAEQGRIRVSIEAQAALIDDLQAERSHLQGRLDEQGRQLGAVERRLAECRVESETLKQMIARMGGAS